MIRLATVTNLTPLRVALDGDDVEATVGVSTVAGLSVDDRVVCDSRAGQLVLLGRTPALDTAAPEPETTRLVTAARTRSGLWLSNFPIRAMALNLTIPEPGTYSIRADSHLSLTVRDNGLSAASNAALVTLRAGGMARVGSAALPLAGTVTRSVDAEVVPVTVTGATVPVVIECSLNIRGVVASGSITTVIEAQRQVADMSSTQTNPNPSVMPANTFQLRLSPLRVLTSNNGTYTLDVNTGDLRIMKNGVQAWKRSSRSSTTAYLDLQGDGNLVLYDGGSAVWNTGTTGAGNALVMQDDGNIVLYSSSMSAIWQSNTGGI